MWEPRRLTTLWASTACYWDSFTLTQEALRLIFVVGCYCVTWATSSTLVRCFKIVVTLYRACLECDTSTGPIRLRVTVTKVDIQPDNDYDVRSKQNNSRHREVSTRTLRCFHPYICNSVAWVRRRELYRPSDRRLSAKLVPTLADRGCCVVSAMKPPQSIISVF
jgi:hypothetical protein